MARTGEPIRTGLVGFGLGGSLFHAPFIEADPRLRLTTVVTSTPDRQAVVRRLYPRARLAGSVDDLVEHLDEVDLVVISTPNRTHVQLAETFIHERRSVVVDKPVAPTSGEVRGLESMAQAAGVRVFPFHNRRWDGDFRTVLSLMRESRFGQVHRFESRFERWQPEIDPAAPRRWKAEEGPGHATGILFDLGTHLVDQAVMALGRPDAVYAERDTRRALARVDDDVFVALSYPGRVRAHLWASAVAADRGPRFRLLGRDGAFVKYGMDPQEAALASGARPSEHGNWGTEGPEAWGVLRTDGGDSPVETQPGAYQLFYAGVAACLLDGADPPVTCEDAFVTARIIEAAQLSSESGQVTRLDWEMPGG